MGFKYSGFALETSFYSSQSVSPLKSLLILWKQRASTFTASLQIVTSYSWQLSHTFREFLHYSKTKQNFHTPKTDGNETLDGKFILITLDIHMRKGCVALIQVNAATSRDVMARKGM